MHSPLPDSSALEAGIIEDSRPSRLSRVQDNVRNLLRSSVFSSVRGSTAAASPSHVQVTHSDDDDDDNDMNPLPRLSVHARIVSDPEVIPSPSSETTTSTAFTEEEHHVPGVLFPPTTHTQNIQETGHQSTLFNSRAVAALHHPDMSDPSMALFLQQKTESRHQRAWKRSRNRKLRYASTKRSGSHWLLCFVSGLLLAAVVGTCEYIWLDVDGRASLTRKGRHRSCHDTEPHFHHVPRRLRTWYPPRYCHLRAHAGSSVPPQASHSDIAENLCGIR